MAISQVEMKVDSMYCLGGVGKLLIRRSANSFKSRDGRPLNIVDFVQLY